MCAAFEGSGGSGAAPSEGSRTPMHMGQLLVATCPTSAGNDGNRGVCTMYRTGQQWGITLGPSHVPAFRLLPLSWYCTAPRFRGVCESEKVGVGFFDGAQGTQEWESGGGGRGGGTWTKGERRRLNRNCGKKLIWGESWKLSGSSLR